MRAKEKGERKVNLYELNKEIALFEFEIDEETGEITNADDLEKLEIEKDEKIEGFALWVKNMKADREALKAERDAFNERIKRLDRKIASVEHCVANELDGQKFETSKVSINWRKTTSVDVTDILALPHECLRFKEPEPDKAAIKKKLSQGETVEGARLIESAKMNIK